MADGSWYPAPVGKRSQLCAWDCVAGRKCQFKTKFAWRDMCRSCGRNKPSVGASQAAASGSKSGGVVDSLEIEAKRRVVVEQPTAHSARKQLEQEVAALSKNESADQRQHKAAVDSCVLLAEMGDKVEEQKTRVQQASVEAGAHHACCLRDVATRLSLLAVAIRKGQQQFYLPPSIRNQGLESCLVTLGQLQSFFPGPQIPATPRAQASQPAAPSNIVPASIPTTIPGFPGAAGSRVDAGASSSGVVGSADVLSGLHAVAQRTAPGWKASRERRRGCCSWRPRPRGGLQDGPCPDSLSSIKKTQWVGWTVNSTERGPEACNADFLLGQETHLPKDALAAEESWMRFQGWRACLAPALFRSPQHGEWVSTKQTARSKGSAGGIELCKGCALAFYHSGTVAGGSSSVATSRRSPSSLRIAQRSRRRIGSSSHLMGPSEFSCPRG